VEGIQEPVGSSQYAVLRRAVLDHVRAERRRWFPPLLHAGVPGGLEEVFAVAPEEALDQALRADVVAALLQRLRRPGLQPVVWLTRPGDPDLQDVDAAWLAGARAASAEAGLALTFVVVTRHGWRDPRSGVGREWKRLRAR
jgi:hypothetical protein